MVDSVEHWADNPKAQVRFLPVPLITKGSDEVKLTIETKGEAVAVARALASFITDALKAAGHLEGYFGEELYYANQRETAQQLQKFVEAANDD